ncbi:hypothetical protein COL26b_009803 [Colletotrichum chrysophilum]|uniref:uncharacterized protein n=1 Tax=Colletotrichum chrysophilum TaxID=1836956 RepID=UPI0023005A64|nr:uncharacterized protein COL26b_009803 [Colletotrichum chrysophilum]KAJ0371007.1 hypothetical protein COL26b_009803 [Colletotrichum chrysophilum]
MPRLGALRPVNLAARFTFTHANPEASDYKDLFPRLEPEPTLVPGINDFIRVFTEAIAEHSARERSKYAKEYTSPSHDEILVDDETVREITPLFGRLPEYAHLVNNPSCRHRPDPPCKCLVPYSERRADSLLRPWEVNHCYEFEEVNGAGWKSWQFLLTLLIRGKMEPLLRLASNPDNDFDIWSTADEGSARHMYENATLAFICLQILRQHPETWTRCDYRLTKMYQRMISKATGADAYSQLPYLSHLYFLGLPERPAGLAPYTRIPQRDVFNVEYMPYDSDILPVEEMLKKRGLPTELVAEVMNLANYKPRRRLKVAHDPFHRDNREELDKYLAECWAVMVRGNVFSKAFGCEMNWDNDLVTAFEQLSPGLRSIGVPEMVRSDEAYVPMIYMLVCRSNCD